MLYRYHLNTRLPYIKLYIENEEFNIDGQRCENIMTCPMRPITSGWTNKSFCSIYLAFVCLYYLILVYLFIQVYMDIA